jgi:hypothetical protein
MISNIFKSPSTKNCEGIDIYRYKILFNYNVYVLIDDNLYITVYCSYDYYDPYLINSNSTNNNKLYIKSKEIINLRDVVDNSILRSHEFLFNFGNKTYQEVVGHEGEIDKNDMVKYIIKKKLVMFFLLLFLIL